MAEVFAGYALGDHGFQKPVAIKRLLPELARDAVFVDRLIEEAKLLVGMQHGNIVSVLDLARDGDDVFLVMEYVDGPSLRQLIKAAGDRGLSLGVASYVVQSAAAGLEFAHARPGGAIIHADVSPSNLLLTTSGEVRVADFGIARREGGCDGVVEGKWAYMAPEQARGEPLTPSSDVFALGVVLYELITGVHPFGQHATADAREHEQLCVIPPRVIRPSIPVGLDEICMRALAIAPRDRFARVQQLSDALTDERFANQWREAASDLAAAIRSACAPDADAAAVPPRTMVTGRPITIVTRSLVLGPDTPLQRPLSPPLTLGGAEVLTPLEEVPRRVARASSAVVPEHAGPTDHDDADELLSPRRSRPATAPDVTPHTPPWPDHPAELAEPVGVGPPEAPPMVVPVPPSTTPLFEIPPALQAARPSMPPFRLARGSVPPHDLASVHGGTMPSTVAPRVAAAGAAAPIPSTTHWTATFLGFGALVGVIAAIVIRLDARPSAGPSERPVAADVVRAPVAPGVDRAASAPAPGDGFDAVLRAAPQRGGTVDAATTTPADSTEPVLGAGIQSVLARMRISPSIPPPPARAAKTQESSPASELPASVPSTPVAMSADPGAVPSEPKRESSEATPARRGSARGDPTNRKREREREERVATGTLRVSVAPWGWVSLDGGARVDGNGTFRLAPGRHTLRAFDDDGRAVAKTLVIEAGRVKSVKVRIEDKIIEEFD